MRSALPLWSVEAGETKVRLIYQSSALERVAWPFIPQAGVRQAAQFLVDEWQQSIERLAVSLPPLLQQ